ncbi:MAG: prepilin-type N-terminal cleavage/methylation domain-containing protein, partial [Gemmataceae bacterium]
MNNKSIQTRAFTLIELLIVIAIIGLLAALALPAITGALQRAQLTGVVSNARQIHIAAQQMALDVLTGSSTVGWPGDNNTPATATALSYLQEI